MHLHLRDTNPDVTAAWRTQFADLSDAGRVTISFGDILDAESSGALVSPANSFSVMDGGIDAAYLLHFGFHLQARVQEAIEATSAGELPVGSALVVDTGDARFPSLVVAPTMRIPSDVSGTVNAYLALRAALVAARNHGIGELLSPGLCTSVGAMDPLVAARQMRHAWDAIIEGRRLVDLEQARHSHAALRGFEWALRS